MIILSCLMKVKFFELNYVEYKIDKSKLYICEVNNVKVFIFFRGMGRVVILEVVWWFDFCCGFYLFKVMLMNRRLLKFFFCNIVFGFFN